MAASGAFSQAMALAKMPSLLPTLQHMAVPDDVTEALMVFARDEGAINHAVSRAGIGRQHLLPCVDTYIRKVLLHEKADPLRVLGLRDDNDKKRMQLHRKLLLQRLHPDKSKDEADVAYTRRVLDAWKSVTGEDPKSGEGLKRTAPFRQPRMRWIRIHLERPSLSRLFARLRRKPI